MTKLFFLYRVFRLTPAEAAFWLGHFRTYSDRFSHNSPTDRARDLFKPSKDAESLLVSVKKFWMGCFRFELFWCDVTTVGVKDF